MPELIAPSQDLIFSTRAALLMQVLGALEAAEVRWCIVHGYEDARAGTTVDVDCILDPAAHPAKLAEIFASFLRRGQIVQWLDDGAQWIVFASDNDAPVYLQLHVSYQFSIRHQAYFPAEAVLATRQKLDGLWIASPAIEFACLLVNRVSKNALNSAQQKQLSDLFARDPGDCNEYLASFFKSNDARLIAMAARTRDWEPVLSALQDLSRHLHDTQPKDYSIARLKRRIRRWLRPDCGFHVVFLGPDGVGKSTVISAIQSELADLFLRQAYFTFAPSLIPQPFQPEKTSPHALPPRSFIASIAKATWWSICYTVGYALTVHPMLARGALVINHRYLLDCLVDPRRYRYAGPMRLLRWIWAFSPKPDAVVLLDADPQVIAQRKHEIALEEITRQKAAYLELVNTLKVPHLVADANQPAEEVVAVVRTYLLELLATRVQRRFSAGSTS